jgi:hypothetical protein
MLWKRLILHNYSDKTHKSPIFPNIRNNKHIKYSLKFPNFSLRLYFLVPSLPHNLKIYDHLGITGPLKRHIVRLSNLLERRALSEVTRRHQNIGETARSHYRHLYASEHLQVILKIRCWDTLEHLGRGSWWRPPDFSLYVLL